MLGLGNYYYPLLTRKSQLSRYHYILYYSCLKTIATKLRISIRQVAQKFGYLDLSIPPQSKEEKTPASRTRIVIKYVQDNKENREVLLSYIELMARLRFIVKNQRVTKGLNSITSDFLVNHKKYWRTQFRLTTCCTVCGSTNNIESHHIRKLDRKHCVGFGQLMSQLQRKQIPLCRECHKLVHAGKYNDLSLDDLHAAVVAKSEGLIIQAHSWDNQAAKPEIKRKLVKWNKSKAYKFNDKNRTIVCEYIGASLAFNDRKLYPINTTYFPSFEEIRVPLNSDPEPSP
jgi:hypothetical protein